MGGGSSRHLKASPLFRKSNAFCVPNHLTCSARWPARKLLCPTSEQVTVSKPRQRKMRKKSSFPGLQASQNSDFIQLWSQLNLLGPAEGKPLSFRDSYTCGYINLSALENLDESIKNVILLVPLTGVCTQHLVVFQNEQPKQEEEAGYQRSLTSRLFPPAVVPRPWARLSARLTSETRLLPPLQVLIDLDCCADGLVSLGV